MKTKKIKLALLIGTLFLPFNTLALNKTETVYSNLDYNGQIAQSIVSNHLSFIGDKDIQDKRDFKHKWRRNVQIKWRSTHLEQSWKRHLL